MELKATIGFSRPQHNTKDALVYSVEMDVINGNFRRNNFEKQAYALKIMAIELRAAVQRVNDRLKSEGLTRVNFTNPERHYDEYGNLIFP